MKNQRTAIISAFPGCGKSYIFSNFNGKEYNGKKWNILDSDSSQFSWIKDENGNNTKERNPDFPNNYINHIKENIGKADIIFVSSHANVRQALDDAGLKYFVVFPEKGLKDTYLDRYKKRGNDENFIKFIDSMWDKFIDDIYDEANEHCIYKVLTVDEPYMTIDWIYDWFCTGSTGAIQFLWTN